MAGNDNYTKLLLHMDGTNGSSTYTDSSASVHTMTAQNGSTITTSTSKFGGAAGTFTRASSHYVSAPTHADWNFGSGDFTIDFWANFTQLFSASGGQTMVSTWQDDATGWGFDQPALGNVGLGFYYSHSGGWSYRSVDWTGSSTGTWFHLALVRNGSNLMFFVNGTQQGASQTITETIDDQTYPLTVGRLRPGAPNYMDGYMDELRISKGIARWTTSFTPPTEPYSVAMRYAIQGSLAEQTRIIIVDESDWSSESNNLESAGAYDITTTSGAKTIIARANSGEAVGFGNVTPAYVEA